MVREFIIYCPDDIIPEDVERDDELEPPTYWVHEEDNDSWQTITKEEQDETN